MPKTLEKTPWEQKTVTMDWSRKLPTGVTIATLDDVIHEKWDGTVSDLNNELTAIDGTSKKTQVKLSGGTLDQLYLVKMRVTWSDGQKREGEGRFIVRQKQRAAQAQVA